MEYSTEVLLNAVKEYPFLYNKRHADFKDRMKKDLAWLEIGKIFGIFSVLCSSEDADTSCMETQQELHEVYSCLSNDSDAGGSACRQE
ncbi:hypothetical protein HPB49_014196 [Dermacentor silvarum]|uniref:Uncharacterized protein n=1 Tax=Dermacentor silvarum TaxID=543639 RepID=A0ACB8DDJ3_DERSI|nr:hypothetical protein HPB49_014196 [Dermacentor silvarum]